VALINSCGILEAIVTDALEHEGIDALVALEIPAAKIADWSFDDRLAVAEKAGLIRGGCARLPEIARRYREITDAGRQPAIDCNRARCAAHHAGASRCDERFGSGQVGFSGAGFSLWVLVRSPTKIHRLKPAPLTFRSSPSQLHEFLLALRLVLASRRFRQLVMFIEQEFRAAH